MSDLRKVLLSTTALKSISRVGIIISAYAHHRNPYEWGYFLYG